MRRLLPLASLALFCAAPAPGADLDYRPVDTSKYLVQPTDAATGFLSNATRALSRVAAKTIDGNGYVKTLNNLFSTSKEAPPTQPNGLPSPSLYPGAAYPSSFTPRMPTTQQYRR